jgi:hypothetical protein
MCFIYDDRLPADIIKLQIARTLERGGAMKIRVVCTALITLSLLQLYQPETKPTLLFWIMATG